MPVKTHRIECRFIAAGIAMANNTASSMSANRYNIIIRVLSRYVEGMCCAGSCPVGADVRRLKYYWKRSFD